MSLLPIVGPVCYGSPPMMGLLFNRRPVMAKRDYKRWTKEEDLWLTNNYMDNTARECAVYLKRTKDAVARRTDQLGLQKIMIRKCWTPEEDKWLADNYPIHGCRYCVKFLKRTYASVQTRAKDKQLRKNRWHNIKGQKFGKLLAVNFVRLDNQRAVWLFKCDCGNYKEYLKTDVARGSVKSCGCQQKWSKRVFRKGYKEISGTKWGGIEYSAKDRNVDFNITIEEAWDIFIKQDRKCRFTGEILTHDWDGDGNNIKQTASLDRIDSSKGYSKENCQWIHKRLQKMKRNMSDEEFIDWCHKISSYCTNQDK